MKHSSFVHLHLHTQYSLLDGAIRIKDLVEKAHEYRMPSLAITDHGNMFGAIDFYKAANKAGIKPIIGCETYITEGSRRSRGEEARPGKTYHLLLLAKNNIGYQNLMKLTSLGYLEGLYYKPRIDFEILEKYKEGLICSTACLKGIIPSKMMAGHEKEAYESAERLHELFGEGNFYLEMMDHGLEAQQEVNRHIRAMGKDLNIPIIATNDAHYLNKEDSFAHDCLLCLQTGKITTDTNRMKYYGSEFYFKNEDEMFKVFKDYPQALENTLEIAEKCNVEIEFGHTKLPHFEPPEGRTLEQHLEHLVDVGLKERYGAEPPKEIRERSDFELKVIKDMGFPGYFLIVADFINWAHDRGIPVGPGRGSAVGSVVSYALNITDLEPTQFNLLFERFLNPERITMPDIDVDFCYEGREQVIDYVTEKYGRNNVSQIITFGTMAARNAIRDVGRVLDIPLGEVDKIAKLIPTELKMTLDKALKQEPELKDLYDQNDEYRKLIDTARSLEGITRHCSTHAAGVVITPDDITNYVPLYKSSKDEITTQFAMGPLEELGLLKVDFLGLRTLTVIRDTIRNIKKTRDLDLDIGKIVMEDEKAFKLLQDGRAGGVFQLESSGMRDILTRLKPTVFEDIIAIISLYRPGPMAMIDDFIKRKHGAVPIEYDHPMLEEILKPTYGIMVYQEQVMQICRAMGGFTLGGADLLRRAMGKKKVEIMKEQKVLFIDGAKEMKVEKKVAEKVFDLMAQFAGYGFNKSHAAAYALISYRTAYLKANYPEEFMAALLTSEINNSDKIVTYINECREMGIEILPPDVNESESDFNVVEGRIRFGMSAIKNVGLGAIEAIIAARNEQGPFDTFFNFCETIDMGQVNVRVIESLIKCGAFDSIDPERAVLLAEMEQAIAEGAAVQKDRKMGQGSLFDSMSEEENSTPVSKPRPIVEPISNTERLQFEKDLLGFYVTGHPLSKYESTIKQFASTTSVDLPKHQNGQVLAFAGIITSIRKLMTKRGEQMARLEVEDLHGSTSITVFPKVYEKHRANLAVDSPMFFIGRVDFTNDQVNFLLSEVFQMDTVLENMASSMHIRVNSAENTEEDLEGISSCIKEFRGTYPLYIHFFSAEDIEQRVLKAGPDWGTSPCPELEKKLESILGKDKIWYNIKSDLFQPKSNNSRRN